MQHIMHFLLENLFCFVYITSVFMKKNEIQFTK